MVQYKLIYFNARGAAEVIRLVFKVAGVDFVDERIEMDDWINRKHEMIHGKLPVLEIDGKQYTQCKAITLHLAREFGLMGCGNMDKFRIHELQELLADMLQKEMVKIHLEQDVYRKKEMATAFSEDSLPKYLDFLEVRLKENNDGKGFFIGEKITAADLTVYCALDTVDNFLNKLDVDSRFSSRPLLKDHFDRVATDPAISVWIAQRPLTDM
ncbi:Glutathione S-transferase A4 [Mactra antiquata]